jgi:chemotaxis protein CheC
VRVEGLTALQIDAIREVGSIGAGHAATALSQLVGHAVDIEVPTLELVEIGEVPDVFGGPETLVGGVYSRILGDVSGSMLFVAPRDSSLALVDLMHGHRVGTSRAFGSEQEVLVTHVASILMSAYLAAVGRLTDLSILPSKASFALDMAGAILEAVTSEAGLSAEAALLLRTRFYDAETSVDAYVFFLPDTDSLEVLLGRLGV